MGNYVYSYGSFSAKFARLNVSEDTIFDDAGISQIGVKYTFNINGWITGSTLAAFQTALNAAQCQMHTPRLTLTISWNDGIATTVLYTFTAATDINYGPLPGTFSVQQFTGGLAALYSWSVTATSKTCYSGACSPFVAPSPVLSITRRWSYSINESGFTRRTVSGKLTVTAQGAPADSFRNQCVPPLPSTFKRESQNFDSSENGREMTFSVVDQEVFNTLPIPISAGRADCVIRTSAGNVNTVSVSGRFEATSANTKADIYDQICILVQSKIPPAVNNIVPYCNSRTITEDIYGNALSFQYEFQNAANGVNLLAKDANWTFGQTPPNSDGTSQPIGMFGSDGASNSGVFTPGVPIYDACTSSITSGGGGSGTPPTNVPVPPGTRQGDYGSNNPDQTTSTPPPLDTSGISASHATNMWVDYHETYSYEVDPGVVFFPSKVAGVPPLRQQVRNPMMTVIQAGYQTQYARSATDGGLQPPPTPIFGRNSLIHSSTSFDNAPASASADYFLYTTHWTYTMVYAQAMPTTTSQLDMSYPNDPRPATNNGGRINTPPEILPGT